MKTETIKLSQIQVNDANPRQITDANFQKLIASILALPKMLAIRPIVIDEMFVALGGNMRFRALTAIADMTEAELLQRIASNNDIQKKSDPEKDALQDYWLAWKDNPVTQVIKASELTDAERREFIIKDNVGYGDWDMDALANEWDMEELKEWGVDVGNWHQDDEEPDIQEGEIDPEDVETRCKEGEIWLLGRHRLMCGDSCNQEDVTKLVDGAVIDLILTDPPYNVDYEGQEGMKIQNDNMDDSAFLQFLVNAFSTANKALKPGGGVLHLARRLGRIQLQTSLQGGRASSPRMSDLEQECTCTGQAGLPVEARTVPIRMERGSSALLRGQAHRGNSNTGRGRNTHRQDEEGRAEATPNGTPTPQSTNYSHRRKQTKPKRRTSDYEAGASVRQIDPELD